MEGLEICYLSCKVCWLSEMGGTWLVATTCTPATARRLSVACVLCTYTVRPISGADFPLAGDADLAPEYQERASRHRMHGLRQEDWSVTGSSSS